MVLLAGLKALLSRYAGETDIVVGTPVANRTRSEVEGLVGFFVNTLALRTDLSGDPTFAELLARVRDVALGGYAHQEVPFERVVEEVRPERSLDHAPLFQVMLALDNTGRGEVRLGGLKAEAEEVGAGAAKFDLTVSVREEGGRLVGGAEYSTELFEAGTVARLLEHYGRLLEAAAEDDEAGVWRLPLLSEGERLRQVGEWNRTGRDFGAEVTLDQLVSEQAARTPEAVAVVSGDERLTYAQLDERAGIVGRYLRHSGVGAESRVGVLMGRGVGMVVAILGVLKAGGTYVPLDSEYPEARLRWMMEDAGVGVLLTEERLLGAAARAGGRVVCLDRDWGLIAREGARTPQATIEGAQHLAYVIYTSGSTGRPKGVAITHHSAVMLVRWARQVFTDEDLSGVLAATSLSFDLSIFELFVTLSYGGRVIVAENALQLPDIAAEVTLVNTVPSVMTELLRGRGLPPSVRVVNLAGEPLSQQLAEQVYESEHVRQVFNLYGPSEDTTYSTFALIPKGSHETPTIGRPIANTRAYVLDRYLEPVPVGVAGELYLGGDGLARGYLNRPDLTAEKFVPDPFSPEPGARLYRTGDLARYLSDGRIEFLGRIDHQVKLRGFRIELGEIESALESRPGVRQSLAVVREDAPGQRRLVAYVLAEEATALSVGELREHLRAQLPDYMIPSAFVVLDEFPLTPNGKVDRRRLPTPEGEASGGADSSAPRTPTEELLAGIWCEVLGRERVGARENFFDAGGHSLLATRLVSRVREAFGAEVPLRAVFTHPTVEALALLVEQARGRQDDGRDEPFTAVARDANVPLSFAQQRLWFLDQLEPGDATYNIAAAVSLDGPLDIAALEHAFNEVVRRHEALRTTFEAAGTSPAQVIRPARARTLPLLDLGGLPRAEREAEVGRLTREEAAQPFDLGGGDLLRTRLLRLGPERHLLLFAMHHIVGDAWSLRVLVEELAALYAAHREGRPAALEELPVQYADFAHWQRRRLGGGLLQDQLSFWQRHLDGAPPVLALPTDRPRPPVRSSRGAHETFELPGELLRRLRELSRREDVTLFMTLLAAFETLLSRYTGETDLVVGTPIANRNRAETEPLIGFFVNTLALRTDLSGDPTFAELLARVRDVALDAYAHQDVPFELLVETLQPERDLSRTPLFQVMFVLEDDPAARLELPGLTLRVEPLTNGTSKFDLTMFVEESGRCVVEYSAELFDAATVRRLAAHFRVLLEGVVADPALRLSRLPLLTGGEREQLLSVWNETRAVRPAPPCVPRMFEEQAARTPDATAVAFGAESLSYRELNRRANRLAHQLRALGVGPDSLVGVCLERSLQLPVAVLAVLKAGGAYVPLDPQYPEPRLRLMAEDAGLKVLLTERRLAAVSFAGDAHVVCLDEPHEEIDARSEDDPKGGAAPDNLVYVLYTSGSTGRPKGVALSHGALANLIRWQVEDSPAADPPRTLQFTSLSFDVSFQEIFSTLCAGGTLVLVSEQTRRDPFALLRHLEGEGIQRLFLPFVALQQLAEAGRHAGAGALRLREVITAGEQLQISDALVSWFGKLDDCALHNHYGPSETHVATAYNLRRPLADWPALPPIGRPIANTQAYVLDRYFQPVPVGVVGELHLGGSGLARGYLNRPDLTAERFVPDPFSEEPGRRLYRTGDLARWLADGQLEFLGRADQQLKVRGFRVEPGEIEAALRQCPAVRDAVVVARDKAGALQLVAYVVTHETGTSDATDAPRAFLRERLPDHMIPTAFVRLDELPLTPSGKVDRRRLPAPETAHARAEGFLAPRTPVEELLAGMWAELLGVERVGVNDNFFDAGGHSLLATRLVSRVREAFGAEVPLRAVFTHPTVEALALLVEQAMGEAEPEGPPLVPVSRAEAMPLSFAQQRLWFFDQLERHSPLYNLAAAINLHGELNRPALEHAFNAVVARHEALRTTFPSEGGRPRQRVSPALHVPLPLADLSTLPDQEREAERRLLAAAEAARPFDLSAGPLLRAALVRLGSGRHLLLVTMHHIVSDGWSVAVLLRELEACYDAFARGREPELPALPVQYSDYAAWQRERAAAGLLDAGLRYWVGHLAGAPPLLALPTDRPRPSVQTHRGASLPFEFGEELTEALRRLARRRSATLFMVLLSGLKALLSRYAGETDIVVGTPVANRTRAEVEGLVGFFVNTLALRTDLSGDPTFAELLGRVRDVALGGYAHQEVPFERVVEEVRPERSLDHAPLFQVMLALDNTGREGLRLGSLAAEAEEVGAGAAKFDLTVSVREEGGRLVGGAEYSTELFEAGTVGRAFAHFERLLRAAPRRLRRLRAPAVKEVRLRQVEEWNRTGGTLMQSASTRWSRRRRRAHPSGGGGGRRRAADLRRTRGAGRRWRYLRHWRECVGVLMGVALGWWWASSGCLGRARAA
nr:AMP-dependent synthetase and ligase [uncultured bacterium]